MELSTREDIDAPIEWVFDRITDHQAFEKIALRRGAEVERTGNVVGFGPEAAWRLTFDYRSRRRVVDVRIAGVERPSGWRADLVAGGIDGTFTIDLVAMSRSRTRMLVELGLSARTLSARLLLQSAKLTKGTVMKRFRHRVAAFAADLEARHRSGS